MQISIGCVRARFARHIAVLILVDACASALGFYLFGFAFAFGDGQDDAGNLYGNSFIGFRFFAMHDMDQAQYFATAVRPYAFWVFEWAVSLPAAPASAVPSPNHDLAATHTYVAPSTCFADIASPSRGIVRHHCLPFACWVGGLTVFCQTFQYWRGKPSALLCAASLGACQG